MSKRILIADDSDTVRSVIRTFLTSDPELEICEDAVDGLDAIHKANDCHPDLILLDLSMPNMNGAEVASILKKTMPQIRIILFTMYNAHVGKSLMSAVGVDAVLSKPDGIAQLISSVKSVLAAPSSNPHRANPA
jgi:DNA-binding NarL/FixJ family response regulator